MTPTEAINCRRCAIAPAIKGAKVECPKCGDSSQHFTKAKAIAAWNNMQGPLEPPAVADARYMAAA